jgi:single-stranded DNA-binding protein
MAYWIAGSILVVGGYQASEARKSRKDAERQQRELLAQQIKDSDAMRGQISAQTAQMARQGSSMEQQAQTAREQFETQKSQYSENKLAMEKQAKEVQAAADEERRKAAAYEASTLKARTRGGRRSLLSSERIDAELGLGMDLGSAGTRIQ